MYRHGGDFLYFRKKFQKGIKYFQNTPIYITTKANKDLRMKIKQQQTVRKRRFIQGGKNYGNGSTAQLKSNEL